MTETQQWRMSEQSIFISYFKYIFFFTKHTNNSCKSVGPTKSCITMYFSIIEFLKRARTIWMSYLKLIYLFYCFILFILVRYQLFKSCMTSFQYKERRQESLWLCFGIKSASTTGRTGRKDSWQDCGTHPSLYCLFLGR